ncbi:MAG: iron transporter [Desulfobacula sp.]|nr:iron transporter [Desulfobacula sp.]
MSHDLFFSRVQAGTEEGVKKGWNGLIWLLKILLPISFVTALLVHFGIIYRLDFLLTPVMSWLCLPPSAALVLIIGLFTGIYGTVAALSVMPFSLDHMTLMVIFILIAHNLIQESIIQGKTGINPLVAAMSRLALAFVITLASAKIMRITPGPGPGAALDNLVGGSQAFGLMLKEWGIDTAWLVLQIFLIITPLMIILELAKAFNIIQRVLRFFSPVLAVLGLDKSCGLLWLTAAFFGLGYGSAVIVEETRANKFDKDELIKLHLSIGVNHSIIEDPVLFLPLGIPIFWLWIPRLVAAVLATYLFSVFSFARRLYAKRACHKKICNH